MVSSIGVSVVMPTYQAEQTISHAIESVCRQTHSMWELIIIDDGSTDDTVSIAYAFTQRDCRIRLLRNQGNLGVAVSRSRGVAEAKHSWIAFLDSDDTWEPEKLTRQLAVLKQDSTMSFCFTGLTYMDRVGRKSGYVFHVPMYVTFKRLLRRNVIPCSSVLLRRELIDGIGMGIDSMIHEDYITWLTILQKISRAVGIDEPLLNYRVSPGSKSGNKLQAAKMQWRTYAAVDIPVWRAAFYFCSYCLSNFQKYCRIRRAFRNLEANQTYGRSGIQ